MNLEQLRVGFAFCGSFCTMDRALAALEDAAGRYGQLVPIVSRQVADTDTRFGAAHDFMREMERICDHRVISTIKEAEPIGPKKLLDLLWSWGGAGDMEQIRQAPPLRFPRQKAGHIGPLHRPGPGTDSHGGHRPRVHMGKQPTGQGRQARQVEVRDKRTEGRHHTDGKQHVKSRIVYLLHNNFPKLVSTGKVPHFRRQFFVLSGNGFAPKHAISE